MCVCACVCACVLVCLYCEPTRGARCEYRSPRAVLLQRYSCLVCPRHPGDLCFPFNRLLRCVFVYLCACVCVRACVRASIASRRGARDVSAVHLLSCFYSCPCQCGVQQLVPCVSGFSSSNSAMCYRVYPCARVCFACARVCWCVCLKYYRRTESAIMTLLPSHRMNRRRTRHSPWN